MKRIMGLIVAVMLATAVQQNADAGVVGYSLAIQPSVQFGSNVPKFELKNLSSTASITNFMFTIGDTAYTFDAFLNVASPSGVSYTFNGLDQNGFGGLTSDVIDLDLTGFVAGTTLSFDFDVDIDSDFSSSGGPSFETVFWNNGSAANSNVAVTFDDGTVLSQTFVENPTPVSGARFEFSQNSNVPEPASLAIFGVGALGLVAGGIRRRKRSA